MYALQECDAIVFVLTFSTMNRLTVNVLAKANEEFNMYSQFNSIVLTAFCVLYSQPFVYCTLTQVLGYTWSNLSNNILRLLV